MVFDSKEIGKETSPQKSCFLVFWFFFSFFCFLVVFVVFVFGGFLVSFSFLICFVGFLVCVFFHFLVWNKEMGREMGYGRGGIMYIYICTYI